MSVPDLNKSTKPLSWKSCAITDPGKVRNYNEDSLLDRSEIGLWLVADGMGGHAKGDMASQMIVGTMNELREETSLVRYIDDIEERMLTVNHKLIEIARASPKRVTIGSTVVIMLAFGEYCLYMWAGDSRLYRLRDKTLRQMTTDHSQVELYIEQGMISREEALVHPHGNMITRAVGATDDLFLDMDIQLMASNDRYLLCSDGLTKHIPDIEIEELLQEKDTDENCSALVDLTLSRGAGDNVTAIVVDID